MQAFSGQQFASGWPGSKDREKIEVGFKDSLQKHATNYLTSSYVSLHPKDTISPINIKVYDQVFNKQTLRPLQIPIPAHDKKNFSSKKHNEAV